ncbi:MAG: hypothetical protein COA63_003175 [Methylophaga sp.]|nr:hypothetical protein [Methylophaga sp.]
MIRTITAIFVLIVTITMFGTAGADGSVVFDKYFNGLKDTSGLAKQVTITVDSIVPSATRTVMKITIAAPDVAIFVHRRNELDDLILNDLRQRIIALGSKYDLKPMITQYNFRSNGQAHNHVLIGLMVIRNRNGIWQLWEGRLAIDSRLPGVFDPGDRNPLETKVFIAQLNGDQKRVAELSTQPTEKAPEFSGNEKAALIKIPLDSLSLLPVKYSSSALTGYKSNAVPTHPQIPSVWKAVNDYGFPFAKPLSLEQLSAKLDVLGLTMKEARQKAEMLAKTMPKSGFSATTRKQYADTLFFPYVRDIQTQMIQIMAAVPRNEESLELSKKVYDALFLHGDRYLQRWVDVFYDPNDKKSYSKLKDPLTQQRFDYVRYNSNLIFKAWKLAHFREMDDIIANKLEKEGADLNLLLIGFIFDLGERVPPLASLDERFCLYEKCSSRFRAQITGQSGQGKFSTEKQLALIADLENRIQKYLSQWKNTHNNKLQSEIALFARDKASARLKRLTDYAVTDLNAITTTSVKQYNQWEEKIGRPLRLLIDDSQRLFEIGFDIKAKDNILDTYGMEGGSYADLNSPYHNLATSFIIAQQRWLDRTEKGTIADLNQTLPTSINDNAQATIVYKRPPRFRNRLVTPSELLFEGMGEQAGKAAAGFLSYGGQIKALENRIKTSRTAFFACYPKCTNNDKLRKDFSRALVEKDLYFLQLTGRSGSLMNTQARRMSLVIEALSPSSGTTLIDHGIPKRCGNLFSHWTVAYGKAHGQDGMAEMSKSFEAMAKLASGSLTAVADFKQVGRDMILKQQQAFKDTQKEYGPYQLCRDQWEFDNASR